MSMKGNDLDNSNARNIAVNCLITNQKTGNYIQDILSELLNRSTIISKDKGLATELAYGTCRQIITLDHLISQKCNRPLRKINQNILNILRVGLYQMLFLESIPDFAAIDEAVNQAKCVKLKGTDGFVNAILRAIQRNIEQVVTQAESPMSRNSLYTNNNKCIIFKEAVFADPKKQLAKYIHLSYSHPIWLIERWLKSFSPENVINLCKANNARPPLTCRVNTLKCTPEKLSLLFDEINIDYKCFNQTIQIYSSISPESLPGFNEGYFTIQDIAAQAVAPILNAQRGLRVLDLCAAPGGKTTHLAELMNNQGEIIACDINHKRLNRINDNCHRLGIEIVKTCHLDQLSDYYDSSNLFDRILIDAPCSNTGVLSKRVELRHRLKPNHIKEVTRTQRELLENSLHLLKPEGKILYSTCSIESIENSKMIETFLENHSDLTLEQQHQIMPNIILPDTETQTKTGIGPYNFCSDGGYTALLSYK